MNETSFSIDIKPVRPPKRKRKRARNPNPEVRRRLLEAADELIRQEGVPKLRVEDVAQRAKLSVGTFYLYFDGKDDLFANLSIEHTEGLRRSLQDAYATQGTVAERLARGLDAFFDFVLDHDKGFLYFRDAGTVHTTVGPLSTWAFRVLSEEVRPLLEQAMEEGTARRVDSNLAAQAVIGQVHHTAGYWLEHRDAYTLEEVKRFLARLIAVGLRIL